MTQGLRTVTRGVARLSTHLWRWKGETHLTVVAKGAFALEPGRDATPLPADELIEQDRHVERDPRRPLEEATEVVPFKPRAEVLVHGAAYAPPGTTETARTIRVAVLRKHPVMQKTLYVYGDRAAGEAPAPFRRMPITYERAPKGPKNPHGIGSKSDRQPNVLCPDGGPGVPGLGPVREDRASAAFKTVTHELGLELLDIPDDYNWVGCQRAPVDQRCDYFQGNERIVLDGMHPTLAHLESRLPDVSAEAWVCFDTGSGLQPILTVPMNADTLVLRPERGLAEVIWRGRLVLDRIAEHASLVVLGGMYVGGRLVEAPEPAAAPRVQTAPPPARRPAPPRAPSGDAPAVPEDTVALPSMDLPVIGPMDRGVADEGVGAEGIVDEETVWLMEEMPRSDALPFAPGSPQEAVARLAQLARPEPEENPEFGSTVVLRGAAEELQGLVRPVEMAPELPPESHRIHDEPSAASPWTRSLPPPPPVAAGPEEPTGPHSAPWDRPRVAAPVEAAETSTTAASPAAAPLSGAAPPVGPRRGDAVPVVNRTPLTVALVPWQVRPPRDSLTVIVKGTFDIVADGPARLRDEGDFPVGDVYLDDDPERCLRSASDYAYFKPRADVTLVGHAYAPSGATAVLTELQFGRGAQRFTRRVAVLGERSWSGSLVSLGFTDPAPFVRIPLDYEHAFGGPDFDANPLGRGRSGKGALPNLEDPEHLVKSPSDRPTPACYAPIPMGWKGRWSKLGTYDRRWFQTRWPYFPDDFDWGFFQAAPAAQQLDFLTGDEPFAFVGMRPPSEPGHAKVSGQLPGVRARCAYLLTKDAGGELREVTLHLDTVTFDADEMKLSLVWRGLVEVSDEDAPEIQTFFVDLEPLSAPRSLDALRDRFEIASAPPIEPAPGQTPANEPVPAEDADEDDDELDAEIGAQQAALSETLRAAGIDPDAEPPDAELPAFDSTSLLADLEKSGVEPDVLAEVAIALAPIPPEDDDSPPPEDVRARVVAMLHDGASFDGEDLRGGDLRGLDFSGRSMVEANLRGADVTGSSFAAANLTRAQLSGLVAREARFDDADLALADLTDADCAESTFERAHLGDATLTGIRAESCSFRGAHGARAQLAGAGLDHAGFEDAKLPAADFTRARLSGATFTRASMPDVRLYDASAPEAVFDDAELTNARAEGLAAPHSRWTRARLAGSVFEHGALDGASFLDADLRGASFVRARCNGAVFSNADLTEARLRRAKLVDASLLKANLMMASLERADLTRADFRGANLHGSEAWKAITTGTNLDLALVTQSKLGRSQ